MARPQWARFLVILESLVIRNTAKWWPPIFRPPRLPSAPIVCFRTDFSGPNTLLGRTYQWLQRARERAVPRAWVDVRTLPADSLQPPLPALHDAIHGREDEAALPCLPLLDALADGLGAATTGLGRITFPRYRTAAWLTKQKLVPESDHVRELRRRLPRLLQATRFELGILATLFGAMGHQWLEVLFTVVNSIPKLNRWIWVRGWRVPGLSPVVRWFMTQRYLAPDMAEGFLDFAVELTEPSRWGRPREEVAKLLVHAFLTDIREAYRPRLWHPARWRRTAFPVVFLAGVGAHDAGSELVKWINDVRNATGQRDPLVVFVETTDLPGTRRPGELADWGTRDAQDPYLRWRREILGRSALRDSAAWCLPLVLPRELVGPLEFPASNPPIVPPAAPLFVRPRVLRAAALILAVGLVVAATAFVLPRYLEHCLAPPWDTDIGLEFRGGECVGFSADDSYLFGDDPALREMQQEVFHQNNQAEDALVHNPGRPMVTLVYLAAFTYPDDNWKYPEAQVDSLAGIAAQQRYLNNFPNASTPLLRIVLANGGSGMRQASWVVRTMLPDLIHDPDRPVSGVVGLDRSTADTSQAITELGAMGVPTFGMTISDDSFAEASPLYFQAVPSNKDQAQLVADYVMGAHWHRPGDNKLVGYGGVEFYQQSDPRDLFVQSIVRDVRRVLRDRKRGDWVPEHRGVQKWEDQGQINHLGVPCVDAHDDAPKLVFYAGRNEDFGVFIDHVTQTCAEQHKDPPHILGADLVNFITDPRFTNAVHKGTVIRYIASGVAPSSSSRVSCLDSKQPTAPGADMSVLCEKLQDMRRDLHNYQPVYVRERTAVAYDVVGAFVRAARVITDEHGQVNSATVVAALRDPGSQGQLGIPSIPGFLGVTWVQPEFGRIAERAVMGIRTVGENTTTGNVIEQQPRCVVLSGRRLEPDPANVGLYTGSVDIRGAEGRDPDGCTSDNRSSLESWTPPHW